MLIIIYYSSLLYFQCVTFFGKKRNPLSFIKCTEYVKSFFLLQNVGEKNYNELNLKIAEIFLNRFLY